METCKKGQYYCNTDKKCKPIPDGHTVREDGFLVKEAKKYYGGKNTKPKGFGTDQRGPINQEAERIVRGMKAKSAGRFKKLGGEPHPGRARSVLNSWRCDSFQWNPPSPPPRPIPPPPTNPPFHTAASSPRDPPHAPLSSAVSVGCVGGKRSSAFCCLSPIAAQSECSC